MSTYGVYKKPHISEARKITSWKHVLLSNKIELKLRQLTVSQLEWILLCFYSTYSSCTKYWTSVALQICVAKLHCTKWHGDRAHLRLPSHQSVTALICALTRCPSVPLTTQINLHQPGRLRYLPVGSALPTSATCLYHNGAKPPAPRPQQQWVWTLLQNVLNNNYTVINCEHFFENEQTKNKVNKAEIFINKAAGCQDRALFSHLIYSRISYKYRVEIIITVIKINTRI